MGGVGWRGWGGEFQYEKIQISDWNCCWNGGHAGIFHWLSFSAQTSISSLPKQSVCSTSQAGNYCQETQIWVLMVSWKKRMNGSTELLPLTVRHSVIINFDWLCFFSDPLEFFPHVWLLLRGEVYIFFLITPMLNLTTDSINPFAAH